MPKTRLPWGNKLPLVGWLFGIQAQTGYVAIWRFATLVRHLGEAATPGGVDFGICRDFLTNTLSFALQLRKITEKHIQGNGKALGCSAPNAIHLVDLPIADEGLDWPVLACRTWFSRQETGSTLVQLKHLQICRTR